jgi:hypothetical protein
LQTGKHQNTYNEYTYEKLILLKKVHEQIYDLGINSYLK